MSTAKRFLAILIPGLLLLSCAGGPTMEVSTAMRTPTPSHWRTKPVNASDLTLRQQIGQLIGLRIEGKYYSSDHSYREDLTRYIREDQIGCLLTYRGSVEGTYANLMEFQALSEVPILIASDYERGVGQQIAGATMFPSQMGIAATFNEQNAYEQGRITAIESRAIGIHVTYAPVMDVNNNPLNPIINFRAYSDDPATVAKFGTAFIRGAQDHGMIATAKHFPGHGNTGTDSHTSLPIIPGDMSEIDAVELPPFQAASDAQVGMVMVAHIAVPSLEEQIIPATHSRAITTDLLRGRMGFKGIIVTDGMEMGAVTAKDWTGEAAVKALIAGNDMILLPLHVTGTIDAIERAVLTGRISREHIATSAQRVLDLKASLGLYAERGNLTRKGVQKMVGTAESLKIADRIAAESITLVKDDEGQVPLRLGRSQTLTHLVVSMDLNVRDQMMPLWQNIEWILGAKRVTTRVVSEALSADRIKELVDQARESDKVLVSLLVRIHMNKGQSSIDSSHQDLLDALRKAGVKPIVMSFGSPYIPKIDRLSTYMAAYYYGAVSLRAMAGALFGRTAITGRLPVDLSPEYPRGHGLTRDAIASAFEPSPRNVNFSSAFDAIHKGIEEKVMPGAQVFIVQDGKVLADTAFGHYTYDAGAPKVTTGSIYDLASVTKVFAGGTVAMRLVERRYLVLDEPVWHYYPGFTGGGKEKVTIRHLLTHSSGLHPFYQFWKLDLKPDEVLDFVIHSELDFEPGTKYQYSDLGMILFTALAERVTGKSFEQLVQEWVIAPMSLENTTYNPPAEWLDRIVPTEIDNSLRMALVHGTVHDENTYFMGGVSAHAGLFSTARDLANVGAMILGDGVIKGNRIMKPETIEQFITDQKMPEGSGRALAWQMAYSTGHSGEKFSERAFGHTGYTGTSIWIDPETDLIAVMLTNRVHPTRERGGIRDVRLAFYNAVADAVGSGGAVASR